MRHFIAPLSVCAWNRIREHHTLRAVVLIGLALSAASSCSDDGDGDTPATDGATRSTPTVSERGSTTPTGSETASTTPTDSTTPVVTTDPDGPDLQLFTVPECSVVPNGSLSGADNLTIFVAVRNGGPGTVSGLVPVSVQSDTGLGSRSNNAISTGSSFNPLQVDLADSDYNRTHRFTIVADPDNEIVERDESNNLLGVTVQLPARPSSSIDVPCTSP